MIITFWDEVQSVGIKRNFLLELKGQLRRINLEFWRIKFLKEKYRG